KHRIPAIKNKILLSSAVEIADKVRTGEWKAVDVIEAHINRILEVNTLINAVVEIRKEAFRDAQRIDEMIAAQLSNSKGETVKDSILNLPLLGVPFTCKDSVGVEGMRLTCGIVRRKHVLATETAVVVSRLQTAGAILIGITNVPEYSFWWDTENKLYGRTNNPYDLSTIPGGSSGGEAAIISSCGSVFGVGTDIGGSIRLPAFFCGIFGHKVTPGIIPTRGIFPLPDKQRECFFSIGPLCRYASDLLPILKVMSRDYIEKLPKLGEIVDLSRIDVFYMEDDYDPNKTRVDIEIRGAMMEAIRYLENAFKIRCKRFFFHKMRDSVSIWVSVMKSISDTTMANSLAENDGVNHINIYWEFIKSLFGYSKHTTSMMFMALVDAFFSKDSELIERELQKMQELKQQFSYLLGKNGIFLYPTHPETAPTHGTTVFKASNVGFVSIFNVLNTPVTQCTLGIATNGMPIGLQIVSNEYNDHLTIAVANELEKAFGGWVAPCTIDLLNTKQVINI
ncbi:fatty-acid amide hydrolase 2-like protein, partial [Dinothrombium tinctorium]